MKKEEGRNRYQCDLCGKFYVVPSLARECENLDLDNPARVQGDKLSHPADAEKP